MSRRNCDLTFADARCASHSFAQASAAFKPNTSTRPPTAQLRVLRFRVAKMSATERDNSHA